MKKIMILGISASPRKSGNSRYLLSKAMSVAKDVDSKLIQTKTITFSNKCIGPCIACYKCIKKGDCQTRDDFQSMRDNWLESDAVIYSIPVYHGGFPGQLKCFFDRLGFTTFVRYNGMPKFLKIIGTLSQGINIFAGQESVLAASITGHVAMGCIPVGGDPWEGYWGAAGWTKNDMGKKGLSKLYDQGEDDARAVVAAAESVGKRVAQMALVIKYGGKSLQNMLKKETIFEPFLSRLEPENKNNQQTGGKS